MLNRAAPDGGRITDRLTRFADFVTAESPLYSTICHGVATDPVVLEILAEAHHGQPAANVDTTGLPSLRCTVASWKLNELSVPHVLREIIPYPRGNTL